MLLKRLQGATEGLSHLEANGRHNIKIRHMISECNPVWQVGWLHATIISAPTRPRFCFRGEAE